MFIAELDHPEFERFDLSIAAHRHHGRLALPDRGDEAGGRRDAHARDHHRLRHDRDQPGQLPDRGRRSAGAARRAPSAASSRMSRSRSSTPRAASCRAGMPGELCTRGYSVMLGYWDDAEQDRRGDRRRPAGCTPATSPRIDAEGYCNIVGRIKDMVIRGGENIYPREIEEFLYRHPKVAGRAGVRRARREIRRGALRLDQAASRARRATPRRSATSARARSPTTRSRATSSSSTASP